MSKKNSHINGKVKIEWDANNIYWQTGNIQIDKGYILRCIPCRKSVKVKISSHFKWQSKKSFRGRQAGIVLDIEAPENSRLKIKGGNKKITFIWRDILNNKEIDSSQGIFVKLIEDGDGKACISPQAVEAGKKTSVHLTYVVGEKGIALGGGIRVLTYQRTDWILGRISVSTTGRAKIKISQADIVNEVKDSVIERDQNMSFQMLSFTIIVSKEILNKGDKIEISLKDARAQTFSDEDGFKFLIYVDNDGDGVFGPMKRKSPKIKVAAGEITHFVIHAPSLVEKNKAFKILIKAMDQYNNINKRFHGKVKLISNGPDMSFPCEAEMKRGVGKVKDIICMGEGIYRFTAEYNRHLKGRSNPTESKKEIEYYLYWGNMHSHSCLSDGYAEPEWMFKYGREVAGLDFCAISDHSQHLTKNNWEKIKKTTKRYYKPGKFVSFNGQECTALQGKIGEIIVYFMKDDPPLINGARIRYTGERNMNFTCLQQCVPALEELCKLLKGRDYLCISHGLYNVDSEKINIDKLKKYNEQLPVIEIYSEWGSSEYTNNSFQPKMKTKLKKRFTFQEALMEGLKFGVIADGDDHVSMPGSMNILPHKKSPNIWKDSLSYPTGYSAVYAKKLTRNGIFESFRNRRCYGTTGPRIFIDFNLEKYFMGSEIKAAKSIPLWSERTLHIKAAGEDDIQEIIVIRNGVKIYSHQPDSWTAEFDYTDHQNIKEILAASPLKIPALVYYYVKVVQKDNNMAWSSPIWIKVAGNT